MFLFGQQRRLVRRRLQSDPGHLAESDLKKLASCPSFDDEVLSYLERQEPFAELLGRWKDWLESRPWTLEQRARLGTWLIKAFPDPAANQLRPLIDFPDLPGRPAKLSEHLLELAKDRALPVSIFRSTDEALDEFSSFPGTPAEKMALARLRLDPDEPKTVLRLLAAAQEQKAASTLAALFDSEILESCPLEHSLLAAFHSLSWSTFASSKVRFARHKRNSEALPDSRDHCRFLGIVQLTLGAFQSAIKTFGDLLPAREGEQDLNREWLTACARAGDRPGHRVLRETLDLYLAAIPPDDSGRWLGLLLSRNRSAPDPAKIREALAHWRLPQLDDPLFPAIAALLLQQSLTRQTKDPLWQETESRLHAQDPLWLWKLPASQRQYFAAVRGLIESPADPVATAAHLQRILLLPVELNWYRRVLALMTSDYRSELLVDSEGHPTRPGLLLIDLAIRLVDWLETQGLPVSRELEGPLCSEDPRTISATLQNFLIELEYRS